MVDPLVLLAIGCLALLGLLILVSKLMRVVEAPAEFPKSECAHPVLALHHS